GDSVRAKVSTHPEINILDVRNEGANIGDGINCFDLDDYNSLVVEGQKSTQSQTFVDEDNNVLDVLNIHDELAANINLDLPITVLNIETDNTGMCTEPNNNQENIEASGELLNNGDDIEDTTEQQNNEDNIEGNTGKKTRKRLKSKSKQQKIKDLRNKGLAHVNVKGEAKEAKKMGNACENCRFKCSSKVSDAERQEIFSNFWAMGDHTRQQDYIKDHILRKSPAVHLSEENQKKNSIKYFFVLDGKMVFVCKNMFLKTFNISERWVRTILKKLEAGNGHIISPDLRGRHPKVPPQIYKKNVENVEEHINLFKTVPSHFCRAKSQRKYLPSSLNISSMYRLYKVWMPKAKPDDEVKGEKFYRYVFNTKFNLGFHKPKKDRCDLCSVYDLCNAAQKAKLQEKYDLHIKHKIDAKVARKADREYAEANKDTVCYAIYDLQKTLSVPQLETSEVYYKRKLSMYNFTIYNVIQHQGYCYTWNESEAKKGANEIATCVLQFIEKMASNGVKEIIFWSDNCSGQNKNKYLFSMYTFACAKYDIKITHRYMEKGHTMNEADSIHARIERAARFKSIYEPFDWIDIIKNCKIFGNRYEVISVGEKVLNFHPLADSHQKWNDPKAKWRFVREIVIDSKTSGKVKVRHDLSNPEPIEIKTQLKAGRPLNLSRFTFQKAFNGPLELDKNKLKDLAALCNDLVIPSHKHAFYQSLLNFPDLSNPLVFIEENDEEVLDERQNGETDDFRWENSSDNTESDYEEELRNLRRQARQESLSEDEEGECMRNPRRARARQEILSSEGESENDSGGVDDLNGSESEKDNYKNDSEFVDSD
ncbi:Bis(5'-nucleosyl)-tetraphosphatase, symmetrical, partial [Frankliniella fusca]